METSAGVKKVPVAKTDGIIRNHVWASVGLGLIPVPIVDFLGLTGIQINMLRKIAELYDVQFFKDAVKNILSTMIGGALPTAISTPLAISLFKAFPVMGQTAGIVAMPVAGGAATYAIGKVFVRHFDSGGTFMSFDPEKVKDYYAEMFKEGETVAANIKEEKEKKANK